MITSMIVATVALWALATARITGLITHDQITAPIRRAIVTRFDPTRRGHRALMYAIGGFDDQDHGCPWCVGLWVTTATAPIVATTHTHPAAWWTMATLATAQLIGATWTWGR